MRRGAEPTKAKAEFIELQGGKIWAQSHVGARSRFTFMVSVRRGE